MNSFAGSDFGDQRLSRSLLVRKRFQFLSALVIGAFVPWWLRGPFLPGALTEPAAENALLGNVVAITIAFWMRLSVEVYPGIRRSYVIFPAALTGHGIAVVWFVMTRFPYDRLALSLGFLLHVLWMYLLYIYGERSLTRRIAVVPFGGVDRLRDIKNIKWHTLKRPRLSDTRGCDAIVADFGAELPDEWEAFLAEAALAGRIVYQHKQLSESLTGRVELERLSENNFGSLVPSVGYFYLKTIADFAAAVAALPILLPLMALIGLAIRIDSRGPVLFRQKRVGHNGQTITVYKFRTMRQVDFTDERGAAITQDGDERITSLGRTLRKLRLDELPQIFNILRGEMSWIGPRPEAVVLSRWYSSELSFYSYRHVVKPGISGWAQVNQGHVADVSEVNRKLQYDFYYIKYFSPWLDILILVRTIKIMITGLGAR